MCSFHKFWAMCFAITYKCKLGNCETLNSDNYRKEVLKNSNIVLSFNDYEIVNYLGYPILPEFDEK